MGGGTELGVLEIPGFFGILLILASQLVEYPLFRGPTSETLDDKRRLER